MGRWFGAAVWIAVGVVGLLWNFDLIDRDTLRELWKLWKLWPLIPLMIGLRMLFARDGSRRDGSRHDARGD